MSLTDLPPVVASLKRCLRDDYAHASGNPLRRMKIFHELKERFAFNAADCQALAVEEVRYAYQNALPRGEYRNGQGDTFIVDDWGKPSKICKSSPPAPNSIWIPRYHRPILNLVPDGYHFILGVWSLGYPTPPSFGLTPYQNVTPPAVLEGATYLGPASSVPCHSHAQVYSSDVPAGTVFDGQGPYLSAAPALQQPSLVTESEQQPIYWTAENEQQHGFLPATDAQRYDSPATSPPEQQAVPNTPEV